MLFCLFNWLPKLLHFRAIRRVINELHKWIICYLMPRLADVHLLLIAVLITDTLVPLY